MPKAAFSLEAVPAFDRAPSVVLITGDVEFFVEEAAAQAAEKLATGGAEVVKFEDDAPADAVSDALLNRSLFSARRLVRFDISRLLGTEAPGRLLAQAAEAWEKGTPAGKRDAFRYTRALLSALDLSANAPAEEVAEAASRRARKKELAPVLAEILGDLPEEKGGPAVLAAALRLVIERGNDGTVALVTATAPPSGVDLVSEIDKKGLVLEASVGKESSGALARLARARAKEREVSFDGEAIQRLLTATDGRPDLFAAELSKLLEWAGTGGRVRAADVSENVDDEASEDIYAFYEVLGRREAGEAFARLERLFSGRAVRAGDRTIDTEEYWPVRFFGMLADEVRRMLLIRSRLEEAGSAFDSSMSYPAFQARIGPLLAEPISPFGYSPFANAQGQVSAYAWYKAAQRAARYTTRELAAALARAADVDVRLKSSAPPLETLSLYVGQLIAGNVHSAPTIAS
jgi:DNA polymerase III delta subunit